MQVIVVANQKGGVGKSAMAVHLVWLALEQGRSVLMCDLDGQANSSRCFTRTFCGLQASTLFTAEPGTLTQIPQTISDRLSLISADIGINDVEALDLSLIQRPAHHLRGLAVPDDTLCIIDTPPSLGRRLIAALIAADAVVSPMGLNGFSIQGITDLQGTIRKIRKKFNPNLKNLGLLANMVNSRSATHARILGELRAELGDSVLPFTVGNRVAISDAIDAGRPVWRNTSGAGMLKAGQEMRAACEAILGRLS
ncbi:ParA family protein [uncultured Thiodictyon sp.]|uniref:ParA family protein n=1 Tax=uncultured Thiodictyon sp. TaxID=1846217 RepID=UPI0025E0F599|nr:ParA family protein [uncultured Thiodictyon sp.]